ncbi:MAG: arginine--tRNA ligase [Christensenellaceae bacterium]|nr:arginine--tRNA ligase [Christensenellaceae bacterium]
MKESLSKIIYKSLCELYPQVENIPDENTILEFIEVPPNKEMGDYAFPCFRLSKALKKSPQLIAEELAKHIVDESSEAKSLGGYLNFFLQRENFAKKTIEELGKKGENYGASTMGKGKTICLDYSSINIAKRFHIGHLSTTMIGNSLNRIFKFLGYNTVAINHLGDWGTQFGKLIYAYKEWGNKDKLEKDGVDELTDLYVKYHDEAEKDPSLDDKGRAWFKAIEDGDEEALELFDWFKRLTLRDSQVVYDMLDVHFDSYAGESFYNDKMDRVIEELKAKNLLTISDGASVVNLDEYDMPPCLILKKDGASLYATRDIAAVLYRHDTYNFDKCLYVVAYQQDLHFKQVFKVVELMGYDFAKDLKHVSFGMISYEGQMLATRKGHVVYLEDLLNKACEKALDIIDQKSPDLPDKENIARQVGIGAVIYTDLQNNRIKDIDFRWERALNFDGETGPYVQYTHARCCSVLRKAEDIDFSNPDFSALCDDWAQSLLLLISRLPENIVQAAEKYEPSIITRAMTDIAKAYNKYYYEQRIITDDNDATAARLLLTKGTKDVLKTAMYLIGMEAPERM